MVLTATKSLALAYENKGLLADALELNKKLLLLSKTILGVQHADNLIPMNNQAMLLYELGHTEEAHELQVVGRCT